MFAFEVEYLLGRSFAGDFQDRSEPEWPPHPSRLYSALAATYFENGTAERDRQALKWLESQPPPSIHAAESGEAVRVEAFVPANYVKKGDYLPATRNKQPRFFPAQGPADARVHFIWPDADPAPATAASLDEMASRTAYLGRSCSVVRVRVTADAPQANYLPSADGDFLIRVPSPGRLDELAQLFAADQRPSPGAQVRYRNVGQHPEKTLETAFAQMLVFEKEAGPTLPVEASLTVTDAVRNALMPNAQKTGSLPAIIHGHNGTPHCAVVALPFVGYENADGHLMGFAVVPPRGVSFADRRAVLAACGELVKNGLHIKGVGHWGIIPPETVPMTLTLRPSTWTRPAYRWKSVTPVLLDRFPKKGVTTESILRLACERAGLPDPVKIEHQPYSTLQGVPPVPAFRLQRKPDERPRWGVHATLTFPNPVRGPVLLGAGRFFGLGLMRPEVIK
ncbi:MAG: type I-U CRISPR-associated protein Cas5/Cas6 [Thermomicrobiales bacterium]|nr:type I-U CRISPR-associated protein Cas5/Cas6 [Thermomicrobiales bacterium]